MTAQQKPTLEEVEEFADRLLTLAHDVDAWEAAADTRTYVRACWERAIYMHGEGVRRWMPLSTRAFARGIRDALAMMLEVEDELDAEAAMKATMH